MKSIKMVKEENVERCGKKFEGEFRRMVTNVRNE